jgi:hypothetical protein
VLPRHADLVVQLSGRGAHAIHLVGGDSHADAAGADQDAAVRASLGDLAAHGQREVRIIARLGTGGAEIHHFVAFIGERAPQLLLQDKTGMVRANREFHKRGEEIRFYHAEIGGFVKGGLLVSEAWRQRGAAA